MSRAHLFVRAFAALGAAAFLAACSGQSNPSSFPPTGSSGTTAPNTLAVGCVNQYVYTYAPESDKLLQTLTYDAKAEIKAVVWDGSGNLFVGVNTTTDSWVDEYSPGSTTVSRHISNGIHNPGGLATDDAGNLYVANVGVLARLAPVTIYHPKSTSPDVTIGGIDFLYGITIGRGAGNSDVLWLTTDNAFGSDGNLRSYQLDSKVLIYLAKGFDYPAALATHGTDLYLVADPVHSNKPVVFQYDVAGEPKQVRELSDSAYRESISGLTTDGHGDVLFAQYGAFSQAIDVFARDGNLLLRQGLLSDFRVKQMATNSADGLYIADRAYDGKAGLRYYKEVFKEKPKPKLSLDLKWKTNPANASCETVRLAVMR